MEVLITGPNGKSVRVLSGNLHRIGDRVVAPCPFADDREYEVRWYASTQAGKAVRDHSGQVLGPRLSGRSATGVA
jgi:hypothetical protein